MEAVTLECLVGHSAGREVLLGFCSAKILHALSFADVLDEDIGRGYQRRFSSEHSLDFRRYIQKEKSTTIPLTFNLRPRDDSGWVVKKLGQTHAELTIKKSVGKALAQVDCQHRLGHLGDLDVQLPFMFFVGLTDREEMEIFNVINSKAKGLSASLLDFHHAELATDLANDRPELFIALFLKNEVSSPWHRQLDLGGTSTSGLTRRASLRTLQKAIKVFLTKTKCLRVKPTTETAHTVLDFWAAVALVLPEPWSKPRRHLVTKGIGVYALMEIAADLYNEARLGQACDRRYFAAALSDFAVDFDWTTDGTLKGLGGEGGVKAAVGMIREARKFAKFRLVSNG